MATYRLTGPDGSTYQVTAPDAASQDEVLRTFHANLGANGQAKTGPATYDPTEGMSTLEKFNAGMGKSFHDIGMGIGQKLGLVSSADVAEERRLSAPLMKTGAGMAGNLGGNVVMMAPAALIPGAASIPGAAAIGGAAGFLQPAVSGKEALINTGVGALGGAVGQKVANMAAGSVATQQAENALKTAQGAQKAAAAEAASKAGYVIPPEDLGGGAITKIMSGIGGKIKTAQVASQRNQDVTNALSRKALGLPDSAALDANALQAIRDQAGTAYDAIKGTGTVAADQAYQNALQQIGQTYNKAAQAFPGAVKNEIPDLMSALNQRTFSADGAVEMTKVLRKSADQAYRAGNSDLGKASKQAADALEEMLGRHLTAQNMPEALQAFQNARQLIATTYSVQKGLNSTTGDVAAGTLAKQLANGKPLSGDILTIAQASQAFPKATQALKEAPKSISPLDVAFALSHAAGGQAMNLLSLGARPAARSIMLSGPVQRNALANAMKPEEVNALTRLLANREATLPMSLAGGNALAGYLAQQ